MTAEQMKRTDIIHNYIMRGEHGASPMVTASPTACPYKSSLLQPAWTTSVITTTSRQTPVYVHPQSPHSTSPAPPPQSRSPISPLMGPKVMELQVDIADSQQPLNLSKKSPSPSPRPLKLEV